MDTLHRRWHATGLSLRARALVRNMIRMSSDARRLAGCPSNQGVAAPLPLRSAGRRLLFTIVETRSLEVTGMTCDHCASAVRAEISKLAGITAVEVDVATGGVRIAGNRLPDDAALRAAIEEAGYNLAG
jgi:copper chaperone